MGLGGSAKTWWLLGCLSGLVFGCADPRPQGLPLRQERETTIDRGGHAGSVAAPSGQAVPSGPDEPGLCAREADDAVRDIFCYGARPPAVRGLRELLERLNIPALAVDADEAAAANITFGSTELIPTAAFLGHSTALSGHLVSPINPRAVLFNGRTFVAFQRGVQKVEIITRDRKTSRPNPYLLRFEQACNHTSAGCLPGDLYSLQIERDWLAVQLDDDTDLANTPFDCRQCHQRGIEEPQMLMRELRGPWTHFFASDTGDPSPTFSGGELMRDYLAAKGTESYAGMPGNVLRQTSGGTLQNAVGEGQPLEFDAATIEAELSPQLSQLSQLPSDAPPRSPSWDAAFAAFKRGEQQALPYFALRATDPAKQAALTQAYARYRAGELTREQLPDLADIFPDDPQVRAEIGLQVEPEATPPEALIQACGACHNDVLDQTISRARFNIALARMSRDELDLAVERILRDGAAPGAMPPAGMRQLDAAGRAALVEYLGREARPSDDDALLERAAQIGMLGARSPVLKP